MGFRPLTGYFLKGSAIPIWRSGRLGRGVVVLARAAPVPNQPVKRPCCRAINLLEIVFSEFWPCEFLACTGVHRIDQ